MQHLAIFLIFNLIACNALTQNHVGNKAAGDMTIGGIHLFEFHAPGGGIGLGLKLLLVAAVALAILYWWMRRRAKKMVKRTLTNPLLANASAFTSANAFPAPTAPAAAQPIGAAYPLQPMHTCCRPSSSRYHRRRQETSDEEEPGHRVSARLP